jgi:integrase
LGARKRKYKGVERISGTTVRISFTYLGKPWREIETIKTGNESIEHEACKRAEALYLLIKQKIKLNQFNYREFFPKSKKHIQEVDALLGKKGVPTVRDYCHKWLKARAKKNEDNTTQELVLIIQNRLIYIGDNPTHKDVLTTPIDEATFEQVEEMAESWGNSSKTITNKLTPIVGALTLARIDGVIPFNWLEKREIEGVEVFDPDEDEDVRPFNREERRELLKACKHQQDRNLFRFMFWTGLRSSEVVCLTWKDIDFYKGTIRINKSFPDKAKKVKKPKTKASKRLVKILPDCLHALESQKQFTFDEDDKSVTIFRNPNTNKSWSVNRIREHWIVICKLAKVEYRKAYQTRHTYATMMIMAGEQIRWVSSQMGHSSVMHTLDIYASWIDDDAPDSGGDAVKLFSDTEDEE